MEARRSTVHRNNGTGYGLQKGESSSKGQLCEGHSDLPNIVRGFVSKFRDRDQRLIMSSYVPLNVKRTTTEWPGKRLNKRALLCGVSYNYKRKYRLKGTVNDVKDMRDLLINRFAYPAHCIRVLTEFEPEKEFHPTKKNIENSLKWLVEDNQPGDSLVFYFSGHGLRQPDFNNDELDGFDETICPVDFVQEGMIFDNDINIAIVRPLKQGVTLHAIVDACHSGTVLDLQYVYDQKRNQWKDNTPPSGARKSTSGGLAIGISACEDHQLAADTSAFKGKAMSGALTFLFIELIKQKTNITYGQMLEEFSETFDNSANIVKCLNSRTLARLFGYKIAQKPLLSSSTRFDIYSKNVSL